MKRLTDELAAVKARREARGLSKRREEQSQDEAKETQTKAADPAALAQQAAAAAAAAVRKGGGEDGVRRSQEAWQQVQIAAKRVAEEKAARLTAEEEARFRSMRRADEPIRAQGAACGGRSAGGGGKGRQHCNGGAISRASAGRGSGAEQRAPQDAPATLSSAQTTPAGAATVFPLLADAPTREEHRSGAVTRLQRWWRHRVLQRVWYELVQDVVGYHKLMRQLKQGARRSGCRRGGGVASCVIRGSS